MEHPRPNCGHCPTCGRGYGFAAPTPYVQPLRRQVIPLTVGPSTPLRWTFPNTAGAQPWNHYYVSNTYQ